ncbi:hypothetical protein BD779DRAFT_1680752 [Infundibulicybe gibba]|nr:hypothetical protein BD779DRAFT_1680752 [Infundibulicybe gibba]
MSAEDHFHNFAADEPESLGRSARESFPTPGLVAHNAQLARNRAAQALRAATIEARSARTTQPPASIQAYTTHLHGHRTPSNSHQPRSGLNHPTPDYNFTPEELAEIGDDPFANETQPDEALFQPYITPGLSAGIDDLADGSYITSGQARLQPITSVPVQLPTSQAFLRRSQGNLASTAPSPRPFQVGSDSSPGSNRPLLIRRTHVIPPTISSPINSDSISNKENNPTMLGSDSGQVLGKRPAAGDPDLSTGYSDDENILSGQQERKTGLRASDLNPARRQILDSAILHFRMTLASQTPYPDDATGAKAAIDAWQKALEVLITTGGYRGSAFPTVAEVGLIRLRESWLRGHVKTKVRNNIVAAYGIRRPSDDTDDISSINYNRDLINTLKIKDLFVYRNPPTVIGAHYTVTQLLLTLYAKSGSTKMQNPMIPLVTIAFVLTAVSCCLDEWQTGIFKAIKFDSKIYQPTFERHLKSLEGWSQYSSTRNNATENLQIELLKSARRYAKVPDAMENDDKGPTVFTTEEFANDE